MQRNLERANKKQEEPLRIRRNIGVRISTEAKDLNNRPSVDHSPADRSPDKSPSATEEYWSNFNQISPTHISPGIRSNKGNRFSKIENSRSSSRLSAANEILFGFSGQKSKPDQSPYQANRFSTLNDQSQ